MIARICTEDRNSEWIREQVQKQWNAFTLIRGAGVWNNHLEASLTVEIAILGYLSSYDRQSIIALATKIKEYNDQEAILVEFIESENLIIL